MTAQPATATFRSPPMLRKVFITSLTGFFTFTVSAMLDGPLEVPLADQLILAALVGGVTFIAQFMADFETRLRAVENHAASQLERMEARQDAAAEQTREDIDAAFTRISEATRFYNLVERSALPTDSITQLVERSGQINRSSPELMRNLAHHEIRRLAGLLKSLSVGHEVFYDGEDREWLLGLTNEAGTSISATSLATVDAGGKGFEGGLWMNDLGNRYLDLQRTAVRRGVKIRRIFVFDRAEFVDDPDFVRIRNLQRDAGVHIRILDNSMVPQHLQGLIFDFVLFDDVVSYETTPATQMVAAVKPAIVTTRLILDGSRVARRVGRFEELWAAAHDSD
jgi:hypothetical protein